MGNIVDTIKTQQEKNEAETVEKLQTIHNMMVDKIASSAAKMQNDAIEDKTLPIVAVIDKSEKYKVHVRTAPSNDVSDGINDLLSGDFLGGLKSLIGVALNEFLGNASAGETEKNDFHIIYANNSLLRLDYMMYKYEFSSKGLKDNYENAFCYYLQVGVLDLENVNSQILLYELTRAIGEDHLPDAAHHLASLAKFAKKLYSTVHELKTAAITGGGAAPNPNPNPNPNPPSGGNKEGEGYSVGNSKCKQDMPPALDAIDREVRVFAEEEKEIEGQGMSRTEKIGVIMVEEEIQAS